MSYNRVHTGITPRRQELSLRRRFDHARGLASSRMAVCGLTNNGRVHQVFPAAIASTSLRDHRSGCERL